MVAGGAAPPPRGTSAATVVAAAPLLAACAASLWIAVGWAVGASPFWSDPSLTVSEAAGLGNAGEVVRLIVVEGQDPNRAWPVREGIIDVARTMTPLEATVAIRRQELIPVLLTYGASAPDAGPARTALICGAAAIAERTIVDRLVASGDGSDPRATCPRAGGQE